jgi:hypothetical protein
VSTYRPDSSEYFSIRISTLVLIGVFGVLATVLAALQDVLPTAHQNWSIQYFSSDAAVYFEQYWNVWAGGDLLAQPIVLLNGTPIALMVLLDGNLMAILAGNLALMLVTLKVGMASLESLQYRLWFLAGALIFPYFAFGFLSLNKEIYAMCSAIFFASYWLKGRTRYLVAALLLALAARYYMFVAMAFLAVIFPRERPPRYWLALLALFVISALAPFLKAQIPGYSSQNLLEGAGLSSVFFSTIIDLHGYFLVYPIRYLALVPTRLYSLAIGLGRTADPMEAMVSLLTVILLASSVYVLLCRRLASSKPVRLFMMAVISPIPIMWTEIGHWRYFSFVYFFLLFAVLVHYSERTALTRATALRAGAA